jgi:DNA-binding CsgD family transcriptional regulator
LSTRAPSTTPRHRVDHYCLALTVGYGLFRALMNLTYSTAMATADSPYPVGNSSIEFALTSALAMAGLAVVLLVAGVLRPHMHLRACAAVSIMLLAAVNLGSSLGVLGALPRELLRVALPCLHGITTVVANTAWLLPFAELGARRCLATLVTSVLTGSLAATVIGTLPVVPQASVLAAVGVASAVVLCLLDRVRIGNPALPSMYRSGEVPAADADVPQTSRDNLSRLVRLYGDVWGPLVIYASLTMLSGFVTSFLGTGAPTPLDALSRSAASVAAALFVAVLAGVADKVLDLTRTMRALFPVIGLVLMALPFVESAYDGMFCAVLSFFNGIVNVSYLFLLLETARVRRAPAVAAVSVTVLVARLCLSASLLGGTLLSVQESLDDSVKTLVVTVVCVYLLSMTLLLITRRLKGQDHRVAVPLSSSDIAYNVPGNPADQQEEPASPAPEPTEPLEARSYVLAERYRLTAREREVVVLLARGRTAPYIRTELDLSLNTVRGYIQEAYAKLGIHSKQELIDLFEKPA